MPNAQDFFQKLDYKTTDYINQEFSDCKDAASHDAQVFLNAMRTDLTNWTTLYFRGDMEEYEMEGLLRSNIQSFRTLEMAEVGVTALRQKHFVQAYIGLILDTAARMV